MNKCQTCNINKGEILCKICSKYLCTKCNNEHLIAYCSHASQTYYICEECDEKIATVRCENCEELLCEKCDLLVHNKAKRTLH